LVSAADLRPAFDARGARDASQSSLFAVLAVVLSFGEAKRLIRGGGRVNDMPLTDEAATVSDVEVRDGAVHLSTSGRQHRLIRTK
jgi:hypothetical protein